MGAKFATAVAGGGGSSLNAELERVRRLVDGDRAAAAGSCLPGLERAATVFSLSAFERDVLAIATATELGASPERPTVGGVLAQLAPFIVDWDAAVAMLAPAGHLRRSGLLELDDDAPLHARRIRLAPEVWALLVGAERVAPFAVERSVDDGLATLGLSPAVVEQCAQLERWARGRVGSGLAVAIQGREGTGRDALARALAGRLGFASLALAGESVVSEAMIRSAVRETAWYGAAAIVRGPIEPAVLDRLADELSVPVFVIAATEALRQSAVARRRDLFELAIPPWTHVERAACWRARLADVPCAPDVDPDDLARRVRVGPGKIAAAVAIARSVATSRADPAVRHTDLETGCRLPDDDRQRASGTTLARDVSLADLVVAPATRRELDLLLAWMRRGGRVFGPSGAGARARIGAGLVCLFAGPPGTGKTMAARAIGRELGVEVLRIDLDELVDKYIGETEKNLERVFAGAEARGAAIFFDEADAVFGKRTEIKDAHDRYANIGTSYLLQRIEDHPGLVILATNLRPSLDSAFARRIHVVAEFALPEVAERLELWRRHVVPERLAPDVDLKHLAAKYALSGSEIRNAVATAAVLGAERDIVTMEHLVIAVWRELRKNGRVIQADEFHGYLDAIRRYQGSTPVRG